MAARAHNADEITLPELLGLFWRSKWLMAAITTLVTAVATAYALLAPEWYRAEVLLVPVDSKSMRGLQNRIGDVAGLAGIASLAGIQLGDGDRAEPIAVLQSRNFTANFIEKNDLLPVLFAKKWDTRRRQWKGSDPKAWPDVRDGVRFFEETLRVVEEDKRTGLVALTIDWHDPRLAAEWANQMVEQLNERMRHRALTEAETNIGYLRHELGTTDTVTLQQAIGRLIESELQKIMLARGNKEFSFRFVDRANPPKWRQRPKRLLAVALGVVAGGILSVIVVFMRRSLRTE